MSVLSQPHFHDEAKAYALLESVVWADGVACPHCGTVGGRVYDLSSVRGSKSAKNPQGAIRHGLKKCGECRKQFTVKVGTVFEHARMPLYKMLQAVHLIVSSKKGISAHQLSRVLEVQYKSAWFLAHRIREAMRSGDLAVPFGSGGSAVEVDETYFGQKKDRLKALERAEAAVETEDRSHSEFGVVDAHVGRTDTYHGKPALYIKDRLSGSLVPCVLSDELAAKEGPSHSWTDAWTGKRIRVKGRIYYDKEGKISRISAVDMEDVSPSFVNLRELREIDLLDGKSPVQHLDELWGYSGD